MDYKSSKKKILQKNVKGNATIIDHVKNYYNLANPQDKEKLIRIQSEFKKRNTKLEPHLHNPSLIKKELKAWADSEGFFSLAENDEQVKENIAIVTFNQRQKRMLDVYYFLFELLDETYHGALMSAIKIICREDEIDKMNYSEEFWERYNLLASERQKFENSRNGDLFKKIYNMVRSDDIREWAFSKLNELKKEYNNDFSKVKIEFQRQWNARLAKHPTKIWISSQFDFDLQRIEEELGDRLNMKKPEVCLYSRGKNSNEYAINLVSKFKQDYKKEYKIKVKKRTIAKQKCLCHMFILIK